MREALKKCVIFQSLVYAKDMKVENVILKRKRYVKIKRPLWRISKCLKILVGWKKLVKIQDPLHSKTKTKTKPGLIKISGAISEKETLLAGKDRYSEVDKCCLAAHGLGNGQHD